MLSILSNIFLMLEQTASEKKLTFLYIGLFMMFLMLLVLDARGKKTLTGPKIVYNTIAFLFFLAAIGLIFAYIRL